MSKIGFDSRKRISEAMDGEEWIPVERSIFNGRHPGLVGASRIARTVYYDLLDLCYDLKRSELPEPYLILTNLCKRFNGLYVETLLASIGQLVEGQLVVSGGLLENPKRFRFLRVVGVEVRWAHRQFKSAIREDKIREDSLRDNAPALPDSPALLPEPEKPKNAEKAKTQADRSDFLGHWRSEFLNDRGRKYIAIPGDPKAASQIISAVGLAEAMRLASIFIRAPVDDWQRANTTIRVMQTRLNAIGGENGNGDNAIDRARKQLAESIAARRCEDGRPESNRLMGGELAGTRQGQ